MDLLAGRVALNLRRPHLAALSPVFTALVLLLATPLDAVAQDLATRVRVDSVRSEPMAQTVPVLGRLVARRAGVVSSRINGPIKAFQVEVGDRVEADQIIAVLNDESLAARRNLAAGELQEAQAAVRTKQAELTLAEQDDRRIKGLKGSAAYSKARAEDAAQEVVRAGAELGEARANVTTYQAELRLAEINLYNASIRAPYAGVITERLSEEGAYLQVGAAVVRMVADERLEVEADVPFQRLTGLPVGAEVEISLDDGSKHRASVRAIVPEENPLTRTRAVRFVPTFGPTDKPLAVAQSVTVQVPLAASRDALTVHKDAVIQNGTGAIVYVAENGVVRLQPVKLGNAVGSRFEVLGGLAAGERVVIRGNERLRPGDKIQVDEDT